MRWHLLAIVIGAALGVSGTSLLLGAGPVREPVPVSEQPRVGLTAPAVPAPIYPDIGEYGPTTPPREPDPWVRDGRLWYIPGGQSGR